MRRRDPRPVVAVMWTMDDALVRRAAGLAEEQSTDLILILVVRRPWTLLFDACLAVEFESMELELEALLRAGTLLAQATLPWTLHTVYGETDETLASMVRTHNPGWIVLGRRCWRYAAKVVGRLAFPREARLLIV